MVMKLPLWHCPTAIHLSTACQPAYVCNWLPLTAPIASQPSPSSLVPSCWFRYPHLHTQPPHPFPSPCLSFSLSFHHSLRVWALKAGAVINHWANTVTLDQNTHIHRTHFLFSSFLSSFLSFSPSPFFSAYLFVTPCLSDSLLVSLFRPASSASSLTLAQICST